MNEKQKVIQDMVLELFEALRQNSNNPMGGFEDAVKNMSGIEDGSFFSIPLDIQRNKLLWLDVSFFGRGERALILFDVGLLPDDFDQLFHARIRDYWDSGENTVDLAISNSDEA